MPLFNEPHELTLKRPDQTRGVANELIPDYANPVLEKTLVCMFQTRGGLLIEDEEGQMFPLTGIIYTSDEDVQVEDLIEVALPGTTDKFRVAGREAKYDVDGEFQHLQVQLTRETRF